jgi:hypothetical protein
MSVSTLVIDRALWGTEALLRLDGKMCCLGHLSLACGVPKGRMLRQSPWNLTMGSPPQEWAEVPEWARNGSAEAYTVDSELLLAHADVLNGSGAEDTAQTFAMYVNDSNIAWVKKESVLIALFASQGIALSFTGEFDNA